MPSSGNRRSSVSLVALALLLGTACSTTVEQDGEGVVWLVRHGQYADALDTARRMAEQNPENAHVQALYRDTQVAYFLDQGRSAVFAGNPEEGLEHFYRAQDIDPTNETVQAWITKTRLQLAEAWLDRAAELRGPEDLEEAEAAYERVLEYVPDHPDGRKGLYRVLVLKNHRQGLSKTYFDEGINNFREFWLHPARWNFEVSYRYNRRNQSAKDRRERVDRKLIDDRISQARQLEDDGAYPAARTEYRIALLLDPENATAQKGLERMDKEVEAMGTLAKADMSIRRGDYEKAEELLVESGEITEAQQDLIGRLGAQIEDEKLESMYHEARTFEADYNYKDAVASYQRLLEVSPYYEDAESRKTTLEEFILMAEEIYTNALDADSDEEALHYLREIPILWPEYRDVEERIEELEERLGLDDDPERD